MSGFPWLRQSYACDMRSRAAVRGALQSDGRATPATCVAVPRVGLGRGWKGVCKRAGREPARHSPPFLMSLHIYGRATLATCVARPQSAAPCKATGELRLRHAYRRRASWATSFAFVAYVSCRIFVWDTFGVSAAVGCDRVADGCSWEGGKLPPRCHIAAEVAADVRCEGTDSRRWGGR